MITLSHRSCRALVPMLRTEREEYTELFTRSSVPASEEDA